MSDEHEFLEDSRGVHVIGLCAGGEFTLCGDSFDIGSTEDDAEKLTETKKRTVTCPHCIDWIKHIKGIRFKEKKA